MAVNKKLQTKSLSLEVENGVDDDGNTVYKKRTFSNVKKSAADENIFAVAEGIEDVLKDATIRYFINESSTLEQN